mmetsp:Transcript_15908/g.36562  ORF Transcript_15908/g.36562 Transcript_15908/m.36562 type:complete len:184 (-) Transcript_15908:1173-1724(-)|eukprot:CAMPEP_0116841600 /NCGR_PEP_ID=MMETSP0418-20121206/11029_1 /TAXON_ID=1158023 /ORGANISM="Astrosyne radiata, Strain 13vi08-1A" /LENGTH=183 /DNA_ID=CAMNT_0004472073 /DNA_START=41 /DNA_END=592 /DNA_ORIENTATION=-
MKLSVVVFALVSATAAAFAPAFQKSQRSFTLDAVDRRTALGDIAVGAAALVAAPALVSADGAVSAATITKAKIVYGTRIAALGDAVSKGDFGAVAAEKNAFILFNSGVYPTTKDKAGKAAAIEDTNAIFAAIRSQDAGALKSAYAKYVADNGIAAIGAANGGQSYSSDYSYLARTDAASIYIR